MKKIKFAEVVQHVMRPPGGGIPSFSAGVGQAVELQRNHYSAVGFVKQVNKSKIDSELINQFWKKDLDRFRKNKNIKAVVIGVPLDTGAGIRRGAAYGPRAIREELLKIKEYRDLLASGDVVDLGDIYVNPHLLHDEMLSAQQVQICQKEMYAIAAPALRKNLPVSALSQLELVLNLLIKEIPRVRFLMLGGDHSVAWPMAKVMAQFYKSKLGIVQPDAHTDLLQSRLGVKYCFGTWSFHANELLKAHAPTSALKDGRMIQLGIRQSGRNKDHWEKTTGVKQYWSHEIRSRDEKILIEEIIAHFNKRKITHIYFSNDIDGTDCLEAPATGTPAHDGVPSTFFLNLIDRLGKEFHLVAADVVEVAPDLSSEDGRKKTCKIAAVYALTALRAMIKK